MNSICGNDCTKCEMNKVCKGCVKSGGKPFGGKCVIALCCKKHNFEFCNKCKNKSCDLKSQLIKEFNELNIQDMPKVNDLNALCGSFVNMEYILENGQKVKLLNDNDIYLGNQLCKENSDRCYGIAGDEKYLLVCEYGENGTDPEIIVYKKRK